MHSSAPVAYSISNDKLTLNIPIEEVWDRLSKNEKNPINNDILNNDVFIALNSLIGKNHIPS